jgi:hypothetical protein
MHQSLSKKKKVGEALNPTLGSTYPILYELNVSLLSNPFLFG